MLICALPHMILTDTLHGTYSMLTKLYRIMHLSGWQTTSYRYMSVIFDRLAHAYRARDLGTLFVCTQRIGRYLPTYRGTYVGTS